MRHAFWPAWLIAPALVAFACSASNSDRPSASSDGGVTSAGGGGGGVAASGGTLASNGGVGAAGTASAAGSIGAAGAAASAGFGSGGTIANAGTGGVAGKSANAGAGGRAGSGGGSGAFGSAGQAPCTPPSAGSKGNNPLFSDQYSADPAPFVDNCTFFITCGHDEGNTGFVMKEWFLLSSTDMVTWTKKAPLTLKDFKWADANAWAGQMVKKGGKYYWYVPVNEAGSGMAIGVAVADSPNGPFKAREQRPQRRRHLQARSGDRQTHLQRRRQHPKAETEHWPDVLSTACARLKREPLCCLFRLAERD